MAYTSTNFRTKKSLKEALKAGATVTVYSPGLGTVPTDGKVALEGPHYPAPHSWYANGTMAGGKLVKVS